MHVWRPEDCQWLIQEGMYYPHLTKQLIFHLPAGKGAGARTREPLVNCNHELYQHRIDEVYQSAEDITWPGIEKLLKDLNVLLPFALPKLPWNATCYSEDQIVMWARPTQIPRVMTRYVLPHEVGHGVDYVIGAHENGTKVKNKYKEIRGYQKELQFSHGGEKSEKLSCYKPKAEVTWSRDDYDKSWVKSPDEWWAEDFRYFFGGKHNQFWDLLIPEPDERIKAFFLDEVLPLYDKVYENKSKQ